MIIILSPAKTLNFKSDNPTQKYSIPRYPDYAGKLVEIIRNYPPSKLCELMQISNGLAELNFLRFQKWSLNHFPENSKQSLFAFNGEVYNGLKALSLKENEINFAQKHLRILSGLYGILKPLDLIQPYRLEMGTPVKFHRHKNLYSFWNGLINLTLNEELNSDSSNTLINLASIEYAKAANFKKIRGRIITPVFKELRGDKYQMITVYAKKARGLMTRFIIENQLENPEDIKTFDQEGYAFSEQLSSQNEWVFTR